MAKKSTTAKTVKSIKKSAVKKASAAKKVVKKTVGKAAKAVKSVAKKVARKLPKAAPKKATAKKPAPKKTSPKKTAKRRTSRPGLLGQELKHLAGDTVQAAGATAALVGAVVKAAIPKIEATLGFSPASSNG